MNKMLAGRLKISRVKKFGYLSPILIFVYHKVANYGRSQGIVDYFQTEDQSGTTAHTTKWKWADLDVRIQQKPGNYSHIERLEGYFDASLF
jgi:hypothetical protein